MSDRWRTRWQHQHEGTIAVQAGAIAVLDGQSPLVVVTEEWDSGLIGLLHCDNTQMYRLDDGAEQSSWIMYKYPFDTPRIDVHDGTAVVNTGRGISLLGPPGQDRATVAPAAPDWHVHDLVTGTAGGRAVVAAAWDVPLDEAGLHLRLYDLATGDPCGEPIPPPLGEIRDWTAPATWRLGRWDGQPVVGVVDLVDLLFLYRLAPGGVDGPDAVIVLDSVLPPAGSGGPWPDLLAIDDRCGPTVALVREYDGVHCYDPATGEQCRPPLTALAGAPTAARLGRWRGRQVAAVLTDAGLSLFDLRDAEWVRHVEVGHVVHDVAFAPSGELALVTGGGTMLIEPLD